MIVDVTLDDFSTLLDADTNMITDYHDLTQDGFLRQASEEDTVSIRHEVLRIVCNMKPINRSSFYFRL